MSPVGKAAFLCSCGASARATSAPAATAADVVGFLRNSHLAEGHHEVDAAEHKRIRARQRRDERKAMSQC